jgi:hypothetical protein
MPQTDAIQWLHGTPSVPSNIFSSTTQESDSELDFGAPATGGSYPYLPEFPSLTEKGYTFPPEVVGNGGVEMGVHLVVSTAVAPGSMTSGTVNVQSAATTNATTVIASRTFTLAQLAIAGAHYYIPVSGPAILEFLRCQFAGAAAGASSGTGVAWFGPKTGGEQ